MVKEPRQRVVKGAEIIPRGVEGIEEPVPAIKRPKEAEKPGREGGLRELALAARRPKEVGGPEGARRTKEPISVTRDSGGGERNGRASTIHKRSEGGEKRESQSQL